LKKIGRTSDGFILQKTKKVLQNNYHFIQVNTSWLGLSQFFNDK